LSLLVSFVACFGPCLFSPLPVSQLPVFAVACFIAAPPHAVSTSTPLPSRSRHPERSFVVACFILLLDREIWWTQPAKPLSVTKKAAAKAATLSTSKKNSNPCPNFRRQKTTVSEPRSPHNPPQLHHKNTTPNHSLFAKTPAKTPTPPQPTFFSKLH
jgi:hypothetical protein